MQKLKKWKVFYISKFKKYVLHLSFSGETDVRDAFIAKADYLAQIGDKTEALAVYNKGTLQVLIVIDSLLDDMFSSF